MQEFNEEVIEGNEQVRRRNKDLYLLRLGEMNINSQGVTMVVDQYNTSKDIWVRFTDTGHLVHTSYLAFKKGQVKDINVPSVFGVGYIGVGDYKSTVNGEVQQSYKIWLSMLRRCYSARFKETDTNYIGAEVVESWLNYQNFAKYFEENYYEVDGETSAIDKDLLVKGNKTYSPETCVFLPRSWNSMLTQSDAKRGDTPIGVSRSGNRFMARYNIGKKEGKYIGTYDEPEEAFEAYKLSKEAHIQSIAEKHKHLIPDRVYRGLMQFRVDITD